MTTVSEPASDQPPAVGASSSIQRDPAQAWIALSLIPGLGSETLRKLLQAFGLPEHIFATGYSALANVVKPDIARAICAGIDPQAVAPTLEWLAAPQHHMVTLADTDYPPLLLEIPDPPPLLYVNGRRELLGAPALAIVGSRNASAQGMRDAERFAAALSQAGLTIVSGLALGIDGAAHRGGLKGAASSVAVVGTGLDRVYPASHRELAQQLAAQGALVSEFPLGTPPLAANFPRRNRIISGLARGCLVVEASLNSGSLITARLASEQGREVFAIPGSIHSPFSKGCHALIRQGAKLTEMARDILDELRELPLAGPALTAQAAGSAAAAALSGHPLLAHLGFEPTSADLLAERSGLAVDQVVGQLLELELAGQVACLPGGRYQRLI